MTDEAPAFASKPLHDLTREELMEAVAFLMERLRETNECLQQMVEAQQPAVYGAAPPIVVNRHQRRVAERRGRA